MLFLCCGFQICDQIEHDWLWEELSGATDQSTVHPLAEKW